jgi:hypothetical protein
LPQYLKEHGERLVELGYRIVPIPPGGKGPKRKGWPQFRADAAQVRQWYTNGSAHDGVGIIAATTPAVDVDILDETVAGLMADQIDLIFEGQSLLMRTGRAPKFLIPFRSDNPFRKMSSGVYTDGKHEHKVEILGDGQQWVAYHTHPDTGKPYQWWDGVSDTGIHGVPLDQLPFLQRDDAQRVIDAFELLAAGMVASGKWSVRSAAVEKKEAPDEDPFAQHAEPTNLTPSQTEWVVSRIQNDEDDYERWFSVLCAVHHQLGEDGLELARSYSEKSSKHNTETFEAKYASIGAYTGPMATLRTFLKEIGRPPAAREQAKHPQATKGDPVPFVEGSQFAVGFEDIDWLIEDVVPRAQVGVIYGASGSGKTFFALDMACSIQRGGEWRGKHVEVADSFYIAAEAGNGIRKRIAAYLHAKGAGAMPWFVDYQPNLATLESVQAISESVLLRSDKPGVLFVDTMALSHDGDENSSKDMSLLLRHCKVLSDNTGALVILVHHTGKDESRGMRGSSAIYAGADFVLEISALDRDHEMVVDKLKDGERGARFGFTLPQVEVGTTPRGKVITSCYVLESEKTLAKSGKKGRKPLTSHAQIYIFDVFRNALGMSDSMTETELVEAVKAKQRSEDNVPSQSQSIKGSIAKMTISGHLVREDDHLSLPHSLIQAHPNEAE